MNRSVSYKPLPLIAFAVCVGLSICASAKEAKDFSDATLIEAANYTPCSDGCSALSDTASAFCFRMGDQILVGDGRSYLHENKFSSMEEFAGKQLQIRFNRRFLWIRLPDGPAMKIKRGSEFEKFKDAGCISEVHKPILAAADAYKRPAKVSVDAFALAGSGKGDLFLWFDCTLESDKATISCMRWYRNGDFYGRDWYCARTMEGALATTEFEIDPLLSQDGRLVLKSGAVLRHDGRGRTNDVLDRPNEACR
jgi:hypothetical protein